MVKRITDLYIAKKTPIFCNAGSQVTASGWSRISDGTWHLAPNKSANTMIIDVPVQKGDIITSFRVLGGVMGSVTGGSTTIDADLRRVTYSSGTAVTDASLGAITQLVMNGTTEIDSSKTLTTEHEVAEDYQYYILITGTTNNNGDSHAKIYGAEVDIKRRYGKEAT